MREYILGLDLGPNSIGWAILEADMAPSGNHDKLCEIGFLDTSRSGHPPMGVRVFEAGLENLDTSKEMSLCQQRREARSARRCHARRNARRLALKEANWDAKPGH